MKKLMVKYLVKEVTKDEISWYNEDENKSPADTLEEYMQHGWELIGQSSNAHGNSVQTHYTLITKTQEVLL